MAEVSLILDTLRVIVSYILDTAKAVMDLDAAKESVRSGKSFAEESFQKIGGTIEADATAAR
jgi:hypothetical protein